MEETIGKRIGQNRKRLGLTQDQLAEKLGVTAQAVSKWENDQSCPDINMLPKLAEIFGITVDALLGVQTQQPVPEPRTCEKEEEWEENGFRARNGKWEFHWDSGRRDSLLFAVTVLWVGALTLLSKMLSWEAGFWDILWPSVLLSYGFGHMIHRFSVFSMGCALFGAYFLVENLGIWQLSISGELLWPGIIILLGIGLLIDALRKPAKPRFYVSKKGNSEKTKSRYVHGEDSFSCSLSFGEKNHLVTLPRLAGGEAMVNFGELTVDLQECEKVSKNCRIYAKCSFGELNLLVPKRYQVKSDVHTAFASVEYLGHPDPDPEGLIYLDGNVSFGAIEIKYI